MLPPIRSFKPRAIGIVRPVKAPATPPAIEVRVGVRGRRFALKQAQRVTPRPLAVLGTKRATTC